MEESATESNKQDKIVHREKWSKGIEFVLSGIGFAVGLGNIWRFPYLCYKNGGGAFFIPYFISMITGGVPIFFMEVGIGQYMSEGGITVWNLCPIFKGIGYGTTIICFWLNIYYIVILAWNMHYFINSFTWELPWASCSNEWNTEDCFAPGDAKSHHAMNSTKVDSVVEYWERQVLGITSGIDEIGGMQWELVGCLFLAWFLVYFCVWKGIKSSGKVVYFTAVFPYVMLTVLLVRGVTLPGAWEGIKFYLQPDFTKLYEAQVWIDAGTQIFFSYAIALGCMTALGSYNKYNNNFITDCILISATNSLTSIYSGFAIFSVLGFMAMEQGVPIADVAESGPGLVFIAYPKAVTQMPWAPVWAVSFFFMILIMGLDSQFVAVEGFVTAVVDVFPQYLRRNNRRELFIAGVSCVSFCIGLLIVTKGGMYVFQVFDYYAASGMVLLWFCFFESVAITYFYGVERFYQNITDMIGHRISFWLKISWKIFTPLLTMGILVFSIVNYKPLTYNRTYVYPAWADAFGLFLAIVPMLFIPGYFLYYLLQQKGTFAERLKIGTTPILPATHPDYVNVMGTDMKDISEEAKQSGNNGDGGENINVGDAGNDGD